MSASSTSSRSATANGLQFALRTWGDQGDPSVVLLHGLGGDSSTWDQIGPALATDRFVVAYDARGHGGSDHVDAYSFELMRDDLLGLLDALDLAAPDLVGHSMGGVVAYLFAQAHPQRLRRLVLEETPPPYPRDNITIEPRPDGPLPYDWAALTAVKTRVRTPDPAWLAALPRISAPTLVVAGGLDSQIPQDRIAQLATLIPKAEQLTIEAGHRVHLTRPEEFLVVVEEFLAR